ncbi:MAG: DUF3368 domain-containing protein [Anaerolineae bacterium]|nr:DUF3368 domain-containing protein [Anaerolineae bacterium]
MITVSDTGPLIALAKVDRLSLLQSLFGEILVPPSVYRELLAKYGEEFNRLYASLNQFIRTEAIVQHQPEVKAIIAHLDIGEREAIELAYERQSLLIIDDYLGRKAAQKLGIEVTGVIGVLIYAKQIGLLDNVLPTLNSIRLKGYWLSDEIMAITAKLTKEKWR